MSALSRTPDLNIFLTSLEAQYFFNIYVAACKSNGASVFCFGPCRPSCTILLHDDEAFSTVNFRLSRALVIETIILSTGRNYTGGTIQLVGT